MEILKTTVGHHLKQLFPETVAFLISTFLVEDQEGNRAKEQYKLLCASIYGTTQKGKEIKFNRYCKNLRYDAFCLQLRHICNTTKLEKQNNETIRQVVQNNEHTHELCDRYVSNLT